MIEFVFAASPETIRREPQEFYLHRSVGHLQDLAACALCNPRFSLRALSCGGTAFLLPAQMAAVRTIHREQIRHHLASDRKGRSIYISFLFASFIDQREFMALLGRQLRGFHQHMLNMLVALFRKRCSQNLLG